MKWLRGLHAVCNSVISESIAWIQRLEWKCAADCFVAKNGKKMLYLQLTDYIQMQKYFTSGSYFSTVKKKQVRTFAHDSSLPSNGTIWLCQLSSNPCPWGQWQFHLVFHSVLCCSVAEEVRPCNSFICCEAEDINSFKEHGRTILRTLSSMAIRISASHLFFNLLWLLHFTLSISERMAICHLNTSGFSLAFW